MSAILKITDGTTEVSLINGPIYLESWLPGMPQYKGGGVFADSPISDSRRIVFKKFASVTEGMSIKIASFTQDDTIQALRNLQTLLEKASDYWIDQHNTTPVYLVAKASRESNTRYATIIAGRMGNLGPVMAQPFTNCSTPVLDNISLTIERNHWNNRAPGDDPVGVATSINNPPLHNAIGQESFESSSSRSPVWIESGAVTTFELSGDQVYRDNDFSLHIDSPPSFGGAYQDVVGLKPDTDFTATCWVYVVAGIVELTVSDYGSFNDVSGRIPSTTTGEWEQLTITEQRTTEGLRLSVRADSSGNAEWYMDDIRLYNTSGMVGFAVPSFNTETFVSNKRREDNLDYMYKYDNGTWTENLLYDTNTTGIVMTGTIPSNDGTYFGISAAPDGGTPVILDNGGPFDNIVIKINKVAVGTGYTAVWQYWDGSAWSSILGIVDRTDDFRNLGKNSISWRPPTDWVAVALDTSLSGPEGSGAAGVPDFLGYWIRLKITGGTIIPADRAQMQIPLPFTVTWPYVDIALSGDIGGDLPGNGKIIVKNYGGEIQGNEVVPMQQFGHTYFDVILQVNEFADTVINIGEEYQAGMLFEGLTMGPSSQIISAKIKSVSTGNGSGVTRTAIRAEDIANAVAPGVYNWATWSALDRTTAEVSWQLDGARSSGEILETPDISTVLQEIVDRGDWVAGNDVMFFIEDESSDAASDYELASWEHVSLDPPELTVVWQDSQGGVWLNKVIAGVRDVSRGEDFISHINMTDWQKQPGIKVEANTGSYFESNTRGAGGRAIIIDNSVALVWPVPVPYIPPEDSDYNIIVNIDNVLAPSYIGSYRAFLRVSTDLLSGETANFAIAVRTGSSGLTKFGYTSAEFRFVGDAPATRPVAANNVVPIDLGLINIPSNPLNTYDKIQLLISGAASVGSIKLTVYDLVLIPADQWIGEITTGTGVDKAVLSEESVFFDSTSEEKNPILAYHTNTDGVVKAMLSAFSSKVSLSTTGTMRIFFMFNTIDRDDENTQFGERSSPWAFTGVTVKKRKNFLTLRGSGQ